MDYIYYWLDFLVHFAHKAGYLGIFLMTFLESTFLPIPAELTMIPAGYLIYQGELDIILVILSSTIGTIAGALFGYYLAYKYGRSLILNYGKYFFMDASKLQKIETFFSKHGSISTFTGRLIPGLRHFISFPAGLAKMNLTKFAIYSGFGGALWMITLIILGYSIGEKEEQIAEYLPIITLVFLAACFILIAGYIFKLRNKNE